MSSSSSATVQQQLGSLAEEQRLRDTDSVETGQCWQRNEDTLVEGHQSTNHGFHFRSIQNCLLAELQFFLGQTRECVLTSVLCTERNVGSQDLQ